MSAGNGSLNILTDKAVLLVGVPVNFFQNIDINQDGLLQPDEIKSKRSQIISQLSHGLQVKIGGSTGEVIDDQIIVSVHVDAQNSTPQIEWLRQLQFPSQNVDQPLRIELSTELLASNYLFKVKRSDLQEFAMLSRDHPSHVFFKNQWQTFQSFVIEGWRHIVTGYDHLIFIMVLLASSITFRRWLWVLTSFTLAHGITYSIASMGWVQIQPSLIEPVIALTILLTAILALLKIQLKTSAEIMMIFSFGLFHGLGFASAMNTQLQDASFPLSIVIGFNLGIELGQLVVATTLALIFYLLRQHAHAYERARSGLLWIGFCAGVFWLFERF